MIIVEESRGTPPAAEGATAPETLRHPDRNEMRLWKVSWIGSESGSTEDVSWLSGSGAK